MIALRGDGKTADRIAEALNHEGHAVPRGERYTGHRVRQLFARFGLAGTPPGVRGEGDLPAPGEWWLPALASELGVKPIVVHRWRCSGWLQVRQLRGDNGRWIVWADAAERKRLRRLMAFEIAHHGRRAAPADLTTPRQRLPSRRHHPALRAFADRLRTAGKPAKVVLTAVARKLVVIANAVLRSGKPWSAEAAAVRPKMA